MNSKKIIVYTIIATLSVVGNIVQGGYIHLLQSGEIYMACVPKPDPIDVLKEGLK